MAVGGGIKATFAIDPAEFQAGLKKAAIEYDRRAHRAITLGSLLFESEVKKELSKPGTGRTYIKKSVAHIASAPGQPPAVDKGQLRASITNLVKREFIAWVGRVGTNLKDKKGGSIGAHLEFGTSKMAARPYLLPTLERIRHQLLILFQRVLSTGV